MSPLLLLIYFVLTINSLAIDLIEKDLHHSIDKILRINEHLFLGTNHSLHRLSIVTLNETISPLTIDRSSHLKTLLSIANGNILLCGLSHQGLCQIIDQNFNLIINSSLPIVANDPINSTMALILPEQDLIYFGVTYTHEGTYRWQIPNISGRSLNISRFMKILSVNDNADEMISRDDLALRFMSRQQLTFIVQYIYSFYTKNYIYFLTNQPNDLEQSNSLTKIVRFCRDSTSSIIRTYTEIPLICVNTDWMIKTADIIVDKNNQEILIGHFTRKDGTGGTTICSWYISNEIDRAFVDNYRTCYSMGVGQRGLAFIKPNEPCRKDEKWTIPMNDDNVCPWIISDRLPYPVGGVTPVVGRLFYENLIENSSVLKMYSFDSSMLVFQGLTNGTFKLGLFGFAVNINWFYSYQLSSQAPILSDVIFDKNNVTLFIASGSKIYRLSFMGDCTSRLSCDECLSSSNNPLCGWCTMNQRCTWANDCPLNAWQQESNQCTHIVHIEPLKASVDNSQWINLTLSKLPQLEHNEIYQCIFTDKIMSANTQAIKLDHNRLSCPTPSNQHIHVQKASQFIVRLSVIKWPSNTSIATVPEFTFYNCSSYSSCVSCRSQTGCQWCAQRCSSMCTESIPQCPTFTLLDPSDIFLESGQKSVDIPLKFDSTQFDHLIECRLNETTHGLINSNNICQISKMPEIITTNDQKLLLTLHQSDILIGIPLEIFIYRCDLYDSCDKCNRRSKCAWCQGQCSSKLTKKCLTNEQCTSLRIKDFSPKLIPLTAQTMITIYFNEDLKENIIEILLADLPCSIINVSNTIQCQSQSSNLSRQGRISIRFANSMFIVSKEMIEYRQPSIISIIPSTVYQLGGQILHINGQNLLIGNEQRVFIGRYQCRKIKQTFMNSLSCRLPSLVPGIYNVTVNVDNQMINTEQNLKVTLNPIVQDVDPTISFASGGRLITVRGMYFESIQTITVKFSHKKWNAKLQINSNDILSTEDGSISSFNFRTPNIPPPSNEFPSPPMDVNFSLDFDDSIISLPNLIQFRYIPDVLLNVSSIPPTLPYTGEELKLQVENLTDAASMPDIQLFIGCSECKLKTFTSKGITCQPPAKLSTNIAIVLNTQQQHDDCTLFNASIGPIRFRIGYREYLIGYLSYTRSFSSKYSVVTIISFIFASCLTTIALLILGLYVFYKIHKSKSDKKTSTIKKNIDQNEKQFWSTDTSASTGPYYQVYEQISSLSSHENTLTRAPLLLSCPYYQEKRNTPPIMEQLQMSLSFLTTISVENDQLKKLLFPTDSKFSSMNHRQSMELFYDLLNIKPFSQAFIDQLFENNSFDLIQSYVYLFRYTPEKFKSINNFLQFFSTLFLPTKKDLIHQFHFFDDFLRILLDLIDSSPCDELLNRSSRSISSSTLLLSNLQYRSYQLTIDYENCLRFHISVLDCDTINQVKQKILRYFNSYENTYRLIEYEQLDLILPSLNMSTCTYQSPMLKNYSINSTIHCQKKKKMIMKNETKHFKYHLCEDNQLIDEKDLIDERLVENKNRLQQILIYFYQQIANGLDLFEIWGSHFNEANQHILFQQYIQLVSELIRRLNRLMLCRSTCPIIQSCLNVIADGLEYIFNTKTDCTPEIEFLFMEEKKHFASFDTNNFHFRSSNHYNPHLSTNDIRSLILADDIAIECLFKLYQFYELNSEPINQHIGEHHVSVLLPIHHLLVQIRQLLQSDNQTLI